MNIERLIGLLAFKHLAARKIDHACSSPLF